jgi:hypothetical protein
MVALGTKVMTVFTADDGRVVFWLAKATSTVQWRRAPSCPTKGPENVPADWGKILLQRPGVFSGGGMPRRA